jgi:hypothetical protein
MSNNGIDPQLVSIIPLFAGGMLFLGIILEIASISKGVSDSIYGYPLKSLIIPLQARAWLGTNVSDLLSLGSLAVVTVLDTDRAGD